MCERLAGARGLPAPAQDGRHQRLQRHRVAFSAGYERDTNGIRPMADGKRQGTNRIRVTRAVDPAQAASMAQYTMRFLKILANVRCQVILRCEW